MCLVLPNVSRSVVDSGQPVPKVKLFDFALCLSLSVEPFSVSVSVSVCLCAVSLSGCPSVGPSCLALSLGHLE